MPSDYWLTESGVSLPRKSDFKSNHPYWLSWVVNFDILILGKSPIKWRQRPGMIIAVDWDVKHQFKQTNAFD